MPPVCGLKPSSGRVVEEMSAAHGMRMSKFLSLLYEEALEIHGEVANFASLLRCCCLNFLDPDFDNARLAEEASATTEAA